MIRDLILIGLLTGCSSPQETSDADQPHQLIVIGVDGLDSRTVERMSAEGRLPNLSRLAKAGIFSELRSIEPIISPSIWTSMGSGKLPARHGVWGWESWGGWKDRMIATEDIRVRRYWEILDDAGINCATIGWLLLAPVIPSQHGLTVSSKLVWNVKVGDISAAELVTDDLGGVDAESVSPASALNWAKPLLVTTEDMASSPLAEQFPIVPLAVHPWARDEYTVRVTAEAAKRTHPRVLTAYLKGVDELSHLFLAFQDRGLTRRLLQDPSSYAWDSTQVPDLDMPWEGLPIDEQKIALAGRVVDDYVAWTDSAIGRILEAAGGDPNVIIISDHGFQIDPLPFNARMTGGIPATEHRLMATIILSGPDFEPQAKLIAPSVIDMAPTILYMMGQPVAKDMDGRVLIEAMRDRRDIAWKDTYEDRPAERQAYRDRDETFEIERLRALGYVQ